jgi:hypothetical protein
MLMPIAEIPPLKAKRENGAGGAYRAFRAYTDAVLKDRPPAGVDDGDASD